MEIVMKFIGLTFDVSKLDIIEMVNFLFISVKKKKKFSVLAENTCNAFV